LVIKVLNIIDARCNNEVQPDSTIFKKAAVSCSCILRNISLS